MSDASTDLARFEPAAFFARAAARLAADPTPAVTGDHVLNPGMADLPAYRDAAVLIPVIARTPLSVLFTLRTSRLSSHAGQIAFPGGKIDAVDVTPEAAALREAEEEIGLDPEAVTVIGTLDPYLTGTGFRVVPVLGRVAPAASYRLNTAEVEEIFEVPLAFLMDPGNFRQKSRVLGGRERRFYELEYEGHIIWGATAGIIAVLYRRVFA